MRTEQYQKQQQRLPKEGKQIIAHKQDENIIVYQAFNKNIANYAVANQQFGGSHYSFTRMSWIKPGFLWMMHRAGWATKENQEAILAITLPLVHFKTILTQATISSFSNDLFTTKENWKNELTNTEVRLQWDPDHNPFGNKQERKAIQIGIKGDSLQQFCAEWITKIEDITDFVKSQHQFVLNHQLDKLIVPFEEVINLDDSEIEKRIGITKKLKLVNGNFI